MKTLGTLIKEEQKRRGNISDRTVHRETGVSPTTIGRIKAGYPYDRDTMFKLCAWLGVKPSEVDDAEASQQEAESGTEDKPDTPEELATKLRVILGNRPDLYDKFDTLVSDIVAGRQSADVLVEAIRYAYFRTSSEE